jgi:uncharacterized protein GlcG (DUF336 family)
MRNPIIKALAASASLLMLTGLNAWAAEPLATESHKVLSAALALEAAQAAVAACKSQGYNVTVTIVDRVGAIKLILVGDGARPLTLEVTRRKAYTSAMQRVSTGDFTKRVTTPGAFNPGQFDKELTTGLGGLPIKIGEDTIGGIAAAGAPGGDKDEACASAGLAKISDQLK